MKVNTLIILIIKSIFIVYTAIIINDLNVNILKLKVDENSLQQNNLDLNFNNDLVKLADKFSLQLEELDYSNRENLDEFFERNFIELNLELVNDVNDNDSHEYVTKLTSFNSINSQSILLHVPIHSSIKTNPLNLNNDLNVRGISLTLSLIKYFNSLNIWSKDFLVIFSDNLRNHLERYQQLDINNIWFGLSLDYPSDSFNKILLNFQSPSTLPNLDLLSTLYSLANKLSIEISTPGLISSYKSSILPSKVEEYHTILQEFKIDAISLICIPWEGPHGFLSLGRLLEGLFRSLNNLIERLHASLTIYLLYNNNLISLSSFIPLVGIITVHNLVQIFSNDFKISPIDFIKLFITSSIAYTISPNIQLWLIITNIINLMVLNKSVHKLLLTFLIIYSSLINFYLAFTLSIISLL